MAPVHENIKRLRTVRQLTQAQLADKLGVTRQTISSYESGRTMPDLETAKRLAELLDADVMELLEGQSEQQRSARRIRQFALVLLAVLLLAMLSHALLLWYVNRFLLIPPGTSGDAPLVAERFFWLDVWHTSGSVLWLLTLLGCSGLMLLVLFQRPPIPLRQRLIWLAGLVAGSAVVTLPWALTDPIYAPANYLTAPAISLVTALALFLICLLGQVVRYFLKK